MGLKNVKINGKIMAVWESLRHDGWVGKLEHSSVGILSFYQD